MKDIYKEQLAKDIDNLFKAIEHGDYEHRKWLKDKMDDFVKERKPFVEYVEILCTHCDEKIIFDRDCPYCQKPYFYQESISFLDWVHNNWFIPTADGLWKQDVTHIEYSKTVKSDKSIWASEELMALFLDGQGEN